MVLICPKCEARLRLDEAQLPSHPFSVRCPKCQTSVDVQPDSVVGREPVVATETVAVRASAVFERPVAAPQFNSNAVGENPSPTNRSEERRVGKEGRSRWSPYYYKKNKTIVIYDHFTIT